MKSILKDRSFKISIVLTLVFLITGFVFLHFGMIEYGWAFFVLLPVVLGISIGALPGKIAVYLGLVLAILAFLLGLLALGLEGYLCVLMALPIIVPLIFLGSIITHLIKRYAKIKSTQKLSVFILPLFIILLGGPIEKFFFNSHPEVIEIKSEIVFPYSCMQVYNAIKSVDTLVAEKTFLMKIDLPVPEKCVLEKEEVGGIRTCYFSGGKIVEKITELEKGKILKMDVIKYELTGRKWLGFREAIYLFDSIGINSCKMTRITTYTSALKPRLYWQPLEKMGIEQEHQYVFAYLQNALKK